MKILSIILLVWGCMMCNGEDERGKLLASKDILNEMLIEDKDVTVEYTIYNIGGSAALNVELKDDSFDTKEFEVVQGNTHVQWTRLAPGSNVSHAVILKPIKSGVVNFTSAMISYNPTPESTEKQFGYTSAPGEGRVMNFREYDRRFSPHVTDWAVFGLMTLPSLGMPFLLWYKSKAKYEGSKLKKN